MTKYSFNEEEFSDLLDNFFWIDDNSVIFTNYTHRIADRLIFFNLSNNKQKVIFEIPHNEEGEYFNIKKVNRSYFILNKDFAFNPQTFELTKISGVNLDSKYYRYYKDRIAVLNETNISIYENEHLESIYFDLSKFTNKSSNSILSFEVSPSGRYIALEASKSACARELAGQICSTAMILLYDRQTKMIILEDSGGEEKGLNNRAIYAFSPDDKKFIYLFSMEPLSKLREVRLE